MIDSIRTFEGLVEIIFSPFQIPAVDLRNERIVRLGSLSFTVHYCYITFILVAALFQYFW
jgi:hypothetical protein